MKTWTTETEKADNSDPGSRLISLIRGECKLPF